MKPSRPIDPPADLNGLCRRIYEETRECYSRMAPRLGEHCRSFKILYGPPLYQPDIAFVGYQPGGDRSDNPREQYEWPERLEYLTHCDWPISRGIRRLVGGEASLENCVGMNAIFLRSPNVGTYRAIPLELRRQIADFCLSRVRMILARMEPRVIVLVGIGTGRLLNVEDQDAELPRMRRGEVAGRPAFAVRHLSWPMSENDRQVIRTRILQERPPAP